MRKFYHLWKFCALTINFSKMWPNKPPVDNRLSSTSQKRFEYVSKTSWNCVTKNSRTWQYLLKMSWRNLCKTFWRCLKDVLKGFSKRLEDVLKMSCRSFCKMSWRCPEDVLKMSWRHLENVLKTSWRHFRKTSWRRMTMMNLLVLIKTSSRRLLKTYE